MKGATFTILGTTVIGNIFTFRVRISTFSFLCTTVTRNMLNFSRKVSCMSSLCLCFGLGTTAKNLTKSLKILPVIVKQIDVKIICLDTTLLMNLTIDGPKMAGDKLIFVWWLLKTLTYPKTKVKKLISKCKNLIVNCKAILLELTNLISTLCLTTQVVLLTLVYEISPSLTNPSIDSQPFLPIYKLP